MVFILNNIKTMIGTTSEENYGYPAPNYKWKDCPF